MENGSQHNKIKGKLWIWFVKEVKSALLNMFIDFCEWKIGRTKFVAHDATSSTWIPPNELKSVLPEALVNAFNCLVFFRWKPQLTICLMPNLPTHGFWVWTLNIHHTLLTNTLILYLNCCTPALYRTLPE